MQDHLGFTRKFSAIEKTIFIPRYYNPEVPRRLDTLMSTHSPVTLGNLIQKQHISVSRGHEVGKMAYGTGNIPFVRTSDISSWEIKAHPKQGVSETIYLEYAERQDVQAGDIFFVKDGTYLIGQTCMITEQDLPCVYQSHIFKLRVNDGSPVDNYLLLALLNSPIVKEQIRAKQFTADIIDTIGDRIEELILPVPKDEAEKNYYSDQTRMIVERRGEMREKIRRVPLLAQGVPRSLDPTLPPESLIPYAADSNPGFLVKSNVILRQIFIPKYYDPELEQDLVALSATHDLITLGRLVKQGLITWETGIEVGKMAYGTGDVPFVRTSDLSNWEIKVDPKQSVSERIYEENYQDAQAGDIFIVRDGTYLVGASCIVTEYDTRILYCGGLYKLRIPDRSKLDPYLLLALLNTPIVRRQMRAKQFTRDIIDTLGKRLFDIQIPIPKDEDLKREVIEETRNIVETRTQLRNRARELPLELEGLLTLQ